MRQIRTYGSMRGRWRRGKVRLVRHRQPKGSVTDRPNLNHRATPRLYVRRERWRFFSGCNSHPATESLQPVAIGAAVEVTKPSKPSRKRVARRRGELAGRNVSERRAGLENLDCGSRPIRHLGKAAVVGDRATGWNRPSHERIAPTVPPGYWRQHANTRRANATREAPAMAARDRQPDAREGQAGSPRGDGEARSTVETG
jgi:hypothetical protein